MAKIHVKNQTEREILVWYLMRGVNPRLPIDTGKDLAFANVPEMAARRRLQWGNAELNGLEMPGSVPLAAHFWEENEMVENHSDFEERELSAEKEIVERSCLTDGDAYIFVPMLMRELLDMGCEDIKFRMEDSPSEWFGHRFVVSGIRWKANNWRRIHGFPMRRRKKKNVRDCGNHNGRKKLRSGRGIPQIRK